MKTLFHNEDCTEIFWTQPPIPAGEAGAVIDRYVDQTLDSGVTVFLCNTNARRTNYQSQVWDSFWDGYDPAGPDNQPFLAPMPPQDVPAFRKGIGNMLAVHQQGIDYPARVIQRCRQRGVSPWITLRMNDCHNNDILDHPFHGTFWQKNPQFFRQGCTGYFARCLDYAHPEVRDYYKALIVETLERYDIDGLELDFMREPYLFSAGKEAEGAPILTAWLREVRKLTADTAAKRGHPIRLGVRVPSRPETASAMGLDAVGWAKDGLIDLLVVTPRWATLEFDMPLEQWRELLGSSRVTLTGGLEILYRPWPGAPATPVSPELATGAAVSVLSRGADAVYLFNYFHPTGAWSSIRQAMTSLDSLLKLPRRVGVTYRDITAPGEKYSAPLPATGTALAFSVWIGPVTPNAGRCDVFCEVAPPKDATKTLPAVQVNGQGTELLNEETVKDGGSVLSFTVPVAALAPAAAQDIRISCDGAAPVTVRRLELLYVPSP
ncbi:MAG: hypothetical protein A3K19_03085 [Lentisphaerae bacterium RIFOXYB12_FULL_65_16]|nr:MAG: hypothetical protein A3K18_23510 [Lentisphaerae bacterium RIFOXYA12_64_32]OGV92112.1 MAG: hypothetical protein A3K19_03085 [Lentisphaerae bacterium RIFOXYB12_FULL_65_16]